MSVITVKSVELVTDKAGRQFKRAIVYNSKGEEKKYSPIYENQEMFVENASLNVKWAQGDDGKWTMVSVTPIKEAIEEAQPKHVDTKAILEEVKATKEYEVHGEELRKIRSMSVAYAKDKEVARIRAGKPEGIVREGKEAKAYENYIITGKEIRGI